MNTKKPSSQGKTPEKRIFVYFTAWQGGIEYIYLSCLHCYVCVCGFKGKGIVQTCSSERLYFFKFGVTVRFLHVNLIRPSFKKDITIRIQF